LKHRELLDAAHIIPDNMPEGKSTIENGLSLCKLHHSAYDAFIIGVTPDYVIQVRADILEWNPLCPSDISPNTTMKTWDEN
jgi:putative restriction endonuclease